MAAVRFARFAWAFLAYNALVIVWGAYVRASGSGAGCGSHWPTCNGEVMHRPRSIETVIEMSHRLTSGLALIGSVVLAVWAFRAFPKGHQARRAGGAQLGFMLAEALVGAALVLFEHVAHNPSAKRGLSMSLHLVNTFFLLASLVLTAHLGGGGRPIRLKNQGVIAWPLALSAVAMLVVGTSGAIAALGDTLFPARSLGDGLAQDLSAGSHVFLRLRALHPLFAVTVGALVVGTATLARAARPGDAEVSRASKVLAALYFVQLGIGLANVGLLAPIPLQLVHLVMADAVWVMLVLLGANVMATRDAAEVAPVPARA